MAAELFRRGLRDHGRALLGWCAGAAAYVLFLCAIYPSIGGSADIEEVIQNLPDAVKGFFGLGAVDLTSGSGFVDTELFSIVLRCFPVLLAPAKHAVGAHDSCDVTDRVDAVACGVSLVDHHASVDGQAR